MKRPPTPQPITYIFDLLPGESSLAFAAFKVFRDMGPERSVIGAAKKAGGNPSSFKDWSLRYDWPARIWAHEAYLERFERETLEAELRKRIPVWEKHQQKLRETEWEMHEQAIAVAKKALKKFMTDKNEGASLMGIARMLDIASKLGHLATAFGKPDQNHEPEESTRWPAHFEEALIKIYGPKTTVPDGSPLPPAIEIQTANEQK